VHWGLLCSAAMLCQSGWKGPVHMPRAAEVMQHTYIPTSSYHWDLYKLHTTCVEVHMHACIELRGYVHINNATQAVLTSPLLPHSTAMSVAVTASRPPSATACSALSRKCAGVP
jgi:hypothetical protein